MAGFRGEINRWTPSEAGTHLRFSSNPELRDENYLRKRRMRRNAGSFGSAMRCIAENGMFAIALMSGGAAGDWDVRSQSRSALGLSAGMLVYVGKVSIKANAKLRRRFIVHLRPLCRTVDKRHTEHYLFETIVALSSLSRRGNSRSR